jgi:hypothetical protein
MIIDALTSTRKATNTDIVIRSFTLGFICYFAYYLISLLSFNNLEFNFIENISSNSKTLNTSEILISTALSIPIGLIASYIVNHNFLYQIAHIVKASNKNGYASVLSGILNSNIEWIIVRDIDKNLMYEGWIQLFSDGGEEDDECELMLRDVKVFRNSSGKELYTVPGIYICKKKSDIILEFNSLKYTQQEIPDQEEEEKDDQEQ